MKNIKEPINYAVANRDLKYYIFDWDNNILHMPTKIHLEKKNTDGTWTPHSVSTATFSIIRSDTANYRPPGGDWDNAFSDFRDIEIADQNVFLRDTKIAVDLVVSENAEGAPSFYRFKQALIEGRIFAIVTARGHSPEIIRKGVEYFIEKVLSKIEKEQMIRNLRGYLECYAPEEQKETDGEVLEFYLSQNKYHGIMSPQFRKIMGLKPGSSPNTETGKQFAIHDFIQHVIDIARLRELDKPISIGFSDDDVRNVEAVEEYIRNQLIAEFPNVKFVVYYTDDPNTIDGRKVVINGQLTLDL
jgi:hypothetical protein